jgi:two-component system sensor histidine kinase QseC
MTLVIVLSLVMAIGYTVYQNAIHETEEVFDAQLTHFAQGLLAVAGQIDSDDLMHHQESVIEFRHHHQWALVFQVWDMDKTAPHLLLHSSDADETSNLLLPAEGFSDGVWNGQPWRFYREQDKQRGLDIVVGQETSTLAEMAGEVAAGTVAPIFFGMPILLVLLPLAIRLGLKPLRQLARALQNLSPTRLTPVLLKDEPKEITPVIKALNDLLQRIANAIENERRFTADASHELRTPIAALQAQIQAAQLSGNEEDCHESLAKVMQGTERMGHLVGQLLTLSRLDDTTATLAMEAVDLNTLVQECCAGLGMAAVSRNIEISFEPQPGMTVRGSTDMLRILLRNLLDNAIRYAPQNGCVEVKTARAADGRVELDISDSGAGVPDDQLVLLGQRFNRFGPNEIDGVGLGLSIVRRIAEIHRAQMTFSRATLGGLRVKVGFLSAARGGS